jgi:hypothetical protein
MMIPARGALGMRDARIINALVWLYIWLCQVLLPVHAPDFVVAKIQQLFRFGPFDDLPRLLGRAFVPLVFWAVIDWRMRQSTQHKSAVRKKRIEA